MDQIMGLGLLGQTSPKMGATTNCKVNAMYQRKNSSNSTHEQ